MQLFHKLQTLRVNAVASYLHDRLVWVLNYVLLARGGIVFVGETYLARRSECDLILFKHNSWLHTIVYRNDKFNALLLLYRAKPLITGRSRDDLRVRLSPICLDVSSCKQSEIFWSRRFFQHLLAAVLALGRGIFLGAGRKLRFLGK